MAAAATLNPRESGKYIADHAEHVKIIDAGLEKCCNEMAERVKNGKLTLNIKLYEESNVHPTEIADKDIDWIFMTSALNFSFWNDPNHPPYLVTYKGKEHNGYMSMCAAMYRSIDEGIPIADPKFYGKISKQDLNKYLMGDNDVPCPMITERVQCMHEVGKVLLEKYEGSFVNCLKQCDKSAVKLMNMVIQNFPCFNDVAKFKGKQVAIHKRAQILVADLWQLFHGEGLGDFKDIDDITMFADYRVPQALLYFGALSYSDELSKKLNDNEVLGNGSPMEVEIRGCSIAACDRLSAIMEAKHGIKMNATHVDNFLWKFRREKAEEMEAFPFHKVRSIFY